MPDNKILPFSCLPDWVHPAEELELMYRTALKEQLRKIVVLDDDPTGIQTVHGVSVYTDWTEESIRSGFAEESPMFFILTNSRSMTGAQTESVHREIAHRVCRVSRETGRDFILISRSDSTLRGHWPLETKILAEEVTRSLGKCYDGEVIMPFFREGGRFTFDNIHYVKEDDQLTPAGKTEFAKDKMFCYTNSHIGKWCQEKTGGEYAAEDCIYIDLADIRALHVEKIAQQLMQASGFQKVIVNAVCYADVKVFCIAYIRAMQAGKEFIFRTAAAWTRILSGISDRPLLSHEELVPRTDAGGIILVGSHVNKTTQQLDELRRSGMPIHFMEFDATLVTTPDGLQKEAGRIVSWAESLIRQGQTVAIYTTRKRIDLTDLNSEQQLEMSVAISDAVTSIIGRLTVRPAFILAKGGITSSDVGTKALRVKKATVLGQIMPGVPVWLAGEESKFPGLPYVIFPGNVGDTTTLTRAVRTLMGM